jgi:hypothetical protein
VGHTVHHNGELSRSYIKRNKNNYNYIRSVGMNAETYEKLCMEPVDVDAAREAAVRIMAGKARLSNEFNPNDDDVLVFRAIAELERYRNKEEV